MYYNDYNNTCCRHNINKFNRKENCCCSKRLEETFYCNPSYYAEEKSDDYKKERNDCWEGRFIMYRKKHINCDELDYNNNPQNTCKDNHEEKDNERHNTCCLCNLFRCW